MSDVRDARLGQQLVASGTLGQEALARAQEHQLAIGGGLDSVLLELGLAREPALLAALSQTLHTPPVTAAELRAVDPEVARLISPRIAHRLQVMPIRREGKRLSVAMIEPGDLFVEDELALLTGCMVTSFVALEVRLHEAMARLYGLPLSPLLISVSRRLRSGTQVRPANAPKTTAAPQPGPAVSPKPRVEQARAAAPPRAFEVEVSDEDLELFPSLRQVLGGMEDAASPAVAQQFPAQPILVARPAPFPPLPSSDDQSPEARLAAASVALENAEMRDDIADALLSFCAPYVSRRALLAVRKDEVIGWRGEGIDSLTLRGISIPLGEPSIFVGLTRGQTFWLGSLPPMPHNEELIRGLGGEAPKDCVVLPINLKSKTVCFLYGDNLDLGVGGVPVALLRRLGAKASIAFQVYLLKGKIRTM